MDKGLVLFVHSGQFMVPIPALPNLYSRDVYTVGLFIIFLLSLLSQENENGSLSLDEPSPVCLRVARLWGELNRLSRIVIFEISQKAQQHRNNFCRSFDSFFVVVVVIVVVFVAAVVVVAAAVKGQRGK